jgi:hypothetical protein
MPSSKPRYLRLDWGEGPCDWVQILTPRQSGRRGPSCQWPDICFRVCLLLDFRTYWNLQYDPVFQCQNRVGVTADSTFQTMNVAYIIADRPPTPNGSRKNKVIYMTLGLGLLVGPSCTWSRNQLIPSPLCCMTTRRSCLNILKFRICLHFFFLWIFQVIAQAPESPSWYSRVVTQ